MIYFRIQTNDNKLIADNICEFSRYREFEGNKTFSAHIKGRGSKGEFYQDKDWSVWFVVEDEVDLLRSASLFKKQLKLYIELANSYYKHYKDKLVAHAHTLTTIQSQIRQKIEGFAADDVFFSDSYTESVENISRLVANDNAGAADLICYLHKRISDMRAHLLGVEVVHFGTQFEPRFSNVSLKRAILNQCTPFLKELDEKMVKIRFYFDETCEVDVDKNMFSLVMYNFFSNAVKYTRNNSEIRLNFQPDERKLDISMISLKMEKDELAKLSQEGVRGRHTHKIAGSGVGLFALQKALQLMGKSSMYISPDYSATSSSDGAVYVENHFKFDL